MKTQFCIVCGGHIGLRGWASHVRSEKKTHGENVYVNIRKGILDKLGKIKNNKQNNLLDRKIWEFHLEDSKK